MTLKAFPKENETAARRPDITVKQFEKAKVLKETNIFRPNSPALVCLLGPAHVIV